MSLLLLQMVLELIKKNTDSVSHCDCCLICLSSFLLQGKTNGQCMITEPKGIILYLPWCVYFSDKVLESAGLKNGDIPFPLQYLMQTSCLAHDPQ